MIAFVFAGRRFGLIATGIFVRGEEEGDHVKVGKDPLKRRLGGGERDLRARECEAGWSCMGVRFVLSENLIRDGFTGPLG